METVTNTRRTSSQLRELPTIISPDEASRATKRPRYSKPPATWRELIASLQRKKDGYRVSYFLSQSPGGPAITQEDRDYAGRVLSFFSGRPQKLSCPEAEEVAAHLDQRLKLLGNASPDEPYFILYSAASQLLNACAVIHSTRAAHHNIVLNVRVERSAFLPIT